MRRSGVGAPGAGVAGRPGYAVGEVTRDREGAVAGSVVDDDDFEAFAGDSAGGLRGSLMKGLEAAFLVIGRRDDREAR